MSFVVIYWTFYISKGGEKRKRAKETANKHGEKSMWRCEETLLNHAVQKRKKKCNATQSGMWLYLGKGKCMYFPFMQSKKNTQRKHVNIKVLAWNKFCTQRAFRLFLSCTAVWPSGPLGRVSRVSKRAVLFEQRGGRGWLVKAWRKV